MNSSKWMKKNEISRFSFLDSIENERRDEEEEEEEEENVEFSYSLSSIHRPMKF